MSIRTQQFSDSLTIPAQDKAGKDPQCPAGRAVGGGFAQNDDVNVTIRSSRPIEGVAWRVMAENRANADQTIAILVVCLTAEPATSLSSKRK